MMAKLKRVCNTCVKFPIKFDHKTETFYGKNALLFRSYAAYLGHSKASILICD